MLRGKLEQHKLPGVEIFTGSGDPAERGPYNPKLPVKAWRMPIIPASHPRNEETGDLIFEVLAVGLDGITPKLSKKTEKPYLTRIEMPDAQAMAYNLPPTSTDKPDVGNADERFDLELPLKLADDEYLDLPRLGDGFNASVVVRKQGEAPPPAEGVGGAVADLTPVLAAIHETQTILAEKLDYLIGLAKFGARQ